MTLNKQADWEKEFDRRFNGQTFKNMGLVTFIKDFKLFLRDLLKDNDDKWQNKVKQARETMDKASLECDEVLDDVATSMLIAFDSVFEEKV